MNLASDPHCPLTKNIKGTLGVTQKTSTTGSTSANGKCKLSEQAFYNRVSAYK